MSEVMMLGGFLVAIIIVLFLYNRPYYAINCLYLIDFLRIRFFPTAQVRVISAIQLTYIVICLCICNISYRQKHYKKTDIPCMRSSPFLILSVILVEIVWGLLKGYRLFDIGTDTYKVVEILLYYILFSYTIRSTDELKSVVKYVLVEMIITGVYEIFMTSRGGEGLYLVMTFFFIFFSQGFFYRKKGYGLVGIISFFIVFFSKTRTYLIGFIIGCFIILFYNRGIYEKTIKSKMVLLGICGVFSLSVYLQFFHSDIIDLTISRYTTDILDRGLEVGGYRIYEMQMALQKFRDAPLFGQGFGYREFLYLPLMGYYEFGDFMHNAYTGLLCKVGIFGLVVYGTGVYFFIKAQYAALIESRALGDGEVQSYVLGGLAGTICWMVVYLAAPLTSYGAVFVPGIVGLMYYNLYRNENGLA